MATPWELARRAARGRRKAEQMTPEQALAERERLERERAEAKRRTDDAGAEVDRLDRSIRDAKAARAEALQAQARGGAAVDLDALDCEAADLRRARERASESRRAAAQAAKIAAAEHEQLHRDQFAALAEHAQGLTDEAMQRLEALEPSFRQAHGAWMLARREWNRLTGPNDLEPVPHPPLPEPGTVFGYPPPRPPGVRPEDEPDIEADPDPEPGTGRTFEHVDGRRKRTRHGEMLDRELAKSEEWREVEAA